MTAKASRKSRLCRDGESPEYIRRLPLGNSLYHRCESKGLRLTTCFAYATAASRQRLLHKIRNQSRKTLRMVLKLRNVRSSAPTCSLPHQDQPSNESRQVLKDRTKDPHFVSNPQYSEHVSEIIDGLKKRRKAERDSVVPFMNGDFTGWDLYLAASCEYCMRLVDGMIPMLKSRNFVCAAQLLRAQIRACMRTFALFVCDDVNVFLQTFFSNGRIDKLKDREGERLTDARLKRLLVNSTQPSRKATTQPQASPTIRSKSLPQCQLPATTTRWDLISAWNQTRRSTPSCSNADTCTFATSTYTYKYLAK